MLQSCVELFAAEMVTKGLAPMVRGRDFDALARLYRYCADVAQLPELRRYLAGETLQDTRRGWMPVCVDGYSLGWAKGDGTILKNHYPKALRRPL